MKIGLIGAMEVEIALLKEKTEHLVVRHCAGTEFYSGTLCGKQVVLARCGVGKVNAALCAQILVSVFGVTHLINTGVAGSLNAELDIGDLLISRDAVYHDFDCTAVGYPAGKVPGMDTIAFPADEGMIGAALAAAQSVHPGHAVIGRVASGDQFVSGKAMKERIIRLTDGMCAEMEGAAIAQTAYRNGVPFVIVRAISDKADDSAELDYPTFEQIAARRCAQVTCALVERLG